MSTEDQKKTYTNNKDTLISILNNNNRGTFFNPINVQRIKIDHDSCTVYPTNLMTHAPKTFNRFEQPEDFNRCVMLAKSFEPSSN